jgi:SAM-dependent methyltransferase
MSNLYRELATSFSTTRIKSEPGWLALLELQLPDELYVLDVGCANARFFDFLRRNFPDKQIHYTGIDSSAELLQIAQSNFGTEIKLHRIDLITQLDKLVDLLTTYKFDLIAVHAVMHHIPKLSHRTKLLQTIAAGLSPRGFLHVSFWQFGEYARYQDKINFRAANVGMQQLELEERDYIMSWQRGGLAYRFCHWADLAEMQDYDAELGQSGLRMVANYRADGREQNQNWYWLWQKD